jgi:hypothetical protein
VEPTNNVPGKQLTRFECRELDTLFRGNVKPRKHRRLWVSFDGGPYFSTGKNPNGSGKSPDYEIFEVWMVALEPMLEVRSGEWKKAGIVLNHGVGATYDVLFGKNFDTFDKAGLKFKPVIATFPKGFNATATVRWYPNGTTPDEFGKEAVRLTDLDRKNEFVFGISVGFLFR